MLGLLILFPLLCWYCQVSFCFKPAVRVPKTEEIEFSVDLFLFTFLFGAFEVSEHCLRQDGCIFNIKLMLLTNHVISADTV